MRERVVLLLLPASLVLSHVKELQVYLHIFQNSDWIPFTWSSNHSVNEVGEILFLIFLIEEGSASTKRHDLSKDWIIAKMSLCQALFYIYVYMCVCIHTHTHKGCPGGIVYTHTPQTHTHNIHAFVYLLAIHGMWDLSSWTRNPASVTCIGRSGSQSLDHQGSPIQA